MRLCPKCEKRRRVKEFVRTDKKTHKKYFITACIFCNFNFDIELYKSYERKAKACH